jgi:glycosyltransferase involved in cell wall biosynthesis
MMDSTASAPCVSIITATFNYSSVLRLAIQSVLQQTFQDFEHLIIGDACTDDTEQVVAQFNEPRLRWHNLPTNSGSQSTPNNKGLELARGTYIAYLGHDDIWHPSHLERLVRALRELDADWAHPLAVMIGPPGSGVYNLIGLVPPEGNIADASILTSAVIHKRALVAKTGGWRDYRTLEIAPDLEFHRRAIRASKTLAHVDNLSVFKFPSVWRKNSYVHKPAHEQAAYLARIASEPNFIENEFISIARSSEFNLWARWVSSADSPKHVRPTDPLGSMVESWRRYRGLPPNALTPRPWHELLGIRARRALADLSRPFRMALRRKRP